MDTREIRINGTVLRLEVADGIFSRAKGLMFRRSLGERGGMLFVFPREGKHSFWNLFVPFAIDVIWLDHGKNVIGIEENVGPNSPMVRRPSSPCRYAIELNAGTAKELGIVNGARVDFY